MRPDQTQAGTADFEYLNGARWTLPIVARNCGDVNSKLSGLLKKLASTRRIRSAGLQCRLAGRPPHFIREQMPRHEDADDKTGSPHFWRGIRFYAVRPAAGQSAVVGLAAVARMHWAQVHPCTTCKELLRQPLRYQ